MGDGFFRVVCFATLGGLVEGGSYQSDDGLVLFGVQGPLRVDSHREGGFTPVEGGLTFGEFGLTDG